MARQQRTSFRQRATSAWLALRGQTALAPGYVKSAPFAWPKWKLGRAEWQIIDFETMAQKGYSLNSIIYEAINYKVRAVTTAPLRAYEGDVDNPIALPPGNALADLVARPNPHQSMMELQGQAIVYLNLSGNSYVFMDRDTANGPPVAMWGLRPDRVRVIPIKARRGARGPEVAYVYLPEANMPLKDGTPILAQDMMHVKLPNPLDPLEGMGQGLSPMAPLAQSADVDNAITHFMKLFMQHGAMGVGVLKHAMPMAPSAMAKSRERFKERHGGYQEWAEEIIVLDKDMSYERVSMDFEEMGFEQQDERNETRILGPFGVPPILVGSRIGLKRSTYSNYLQARQAFWEDTMFPESLLFEKEFQFFLQDDGGQFVAFDFSKVPALQELRQKQHTIDLEDYRSGAITRNEYRQMIGKDRVPGGDIFVIVNQAGSLEQTVDESGDDTTADGAPEATEDLGKRKKAAAR